jgi:hypothetical protein
MPTAVTGCVQPSPCTISGQNVTCVTQCSGTCSRNSWWGAYPHFARCAGFSACQFQTGLPVPTGHCSTASFYLPGSCGATLSSWGARIIDCGPAAGTLTTDTCATHTGIPRIASVGPGMYKSITGNSMGKMYTTINIA